MPRSALKVTVGGGGVESKFSDHSSPKLNNIQILSNIIKYCLIKDQITLRSNLLNSLLLLLLVLYHS